MSLRKPLLLLLAWIPVPISFIVLLVLAGATGEMEIGLVLSSGLTVPWRNVGGNPAEVYSHFLNLLTLSGTAFVLSWVLLVDAVRAHRSIKLKPFDWRFVSGGVLAMAICAVGAVVLDRRNGEGVVLGGYLCVAPAIILTATPLFLIWHKITSFSTKVGCALSFTAIHFGLQLWYEPSENGRPEVIEAYATFLIVGLASIGLAALIHASNKRNEKMSERSDSPEPSFPGNPKRLPIVSIWGLAYFAVVAIGIGTDIGIERLFYPTLMLLGLPPLLCYLRAYHKITIRTKKAFPGRWTSLRQGWSVWKLNCLVHGRRTFGDHVLAAWKKDFRFWQRAGFTALMMFYPTLFVIHHFAG